MAVLAVLLATLATSLGWRASGGERDGANGAPDAAWSHRMRLDANYDVLWSPSETDITFEVQVRTLGYVIFGMSPSGLFQDADLVVGWLQNGRPRFQVTHLNSALILINCARNTGSMRRAHSSASVHKVAI